MNPTEVHEALRLVKTAKAQWNTARREFDHQVERNLKRLIHEAAANRMSVADVSRASGLTFQQIRTRMKRYGLTQSLGKTLLSETAADALRTNADLLGVDVNDIDLTSPLAYLTGGRALLNQTTSVRSVDEDELGDDLTTTFQRAWHKRDAEWRAGGSRGDSKRTDAGIAAVLAVLDQRP